MDESWKGYRGCIGCLNFDGGDERSYEIEGGIVI